VAAAGAALGIAMIDRCWTESFPDCEPVADRLKWAFPDRWVRFHSLPGSKRYPESEVEYQIVLDRHNAVLGALTPVRATVIILTTEFSVLRVPASPPDDWPSGAWWRTVAYDDDSFWHVYAAEVAWVPGVFDGLIRRVASDVTGNVMVCDPRCTWVVHPYDGGMDVLTASPGVRDDLRARFRSWLSGRPDGL
jgi:hypothetical protein